MKAEGDDLRLAYMEPESSESGMKLQELDAYRHGFPFKSSRFTIEPGGISPLDKHSVAELWIVIEGIGELARYILSLFRPILFAIIRRNR